jgi:hypothetical protein
VGINMDMRNLFKTDPNMKEYSSGDTIFTQGEEEKTMYAIM